MDDVTVRAEIRLLPTSEGGRTGPISEKYRPNHNFFGPENPEMTIGQVELPAGSELHPGASMEVTITFWGWSRLEGQIYPGREWRIQEGPRVVGIGKVIEIL